MRYLPLYIKCKKPDLSKRSIKINLTEGQYHLCSLIQHMQYLRDNEAIGEDSGEGKGS